MKGAENQRKVLKVHLKLRDYQFKISLSIYQSIYLSIYICVSCYIKPHGTTNQKSITDTHTKKKKESNHNTKDGHQVPRENKRREKTLQQQTQNSF